MKIYLDNASTTEIAEEVKEEIFNYYGKKLGNASSWHRAGVEAAREVERARLILSNKLNCHPSEILFTSSGTESNNFVIKGVAFQGKNKNHIITSAIEHSSVLEVCYFLREKFGFKITLLPVNHEGFVDPDDLIKNITKKTALVTIMQANNEIGTIQPISEIGKICRERGVLFHTDACQSFTKEELDTNKEFIDFASVNSHKIHGPKGVGAIFKRKNVSLVPLFHGGGQENNLRSGTYNTENIVGFGKAVSLVTPGEIKKITHLRDHLLSGLKQISSKIVINGPLENRLCNNVNFFIQGFNGKDIFNGLNVKEIYVSMGAACASGKIDGSHVLKALEKDLWITQNSIRISLSRNNTLDEMDLVVDCIKGIISGKKRNGKKV